ncbi:MAG: hypothetical protein KC621_24260 [Myxococcales bacterium]|nr:hypothetical protein [Myxococcales bacterium]
MGLRRLDIDRAALLTALTARDEGLLGTWLDLRDGTLRALVEPDDEAFEARLESESDHYVKVPLFTREFRLMAEFVEQVDDDELAVRLDQALAGPSAFRAWEGVLAADPSEQRHWRAHRESALEQWAASWLAGIGLTAPWTDEVPAPEVPALLALVMDGPVRRALGSDAEAHTTYVRACRDLCELLREPFPSRRVRSASRFARGPVVIERSGRDVTIRLRADDEAG